MPGAAASCRLPHQVWWSHCDDDLDLVLLEVSYADGGTERYQVLVKWDADPIEEYSSVGHDRHVATAGPPTTRSMTQDAARHLLEMVDRSATVGPLRFTQGARRHAAAGRHATGVVAPSRATPAWCSRQDAVLKVFRRITPGINPDIELNRVLARAGNPHVAPVARLVRDDRWDGEPFALGMVTEFAANSAEGWDMAMASTRDLFAEGDLLRRRGGRRLRRRVLPAR